MAKHNGTAAPTLRTDAPTIAETEAAYADAVRVRIEPLLRRAVAYQRECARLSFTPIDPFAAGESAEFVVAHRPLKDQLEGYGRVAIRIIGARPQYPGYYGYNCQDCNDPDKSTAGGRADLPPTFGAYKAQHASLSASLRDDTDCTTLAGLIAVEIMRLARLVELMEASLAGAKHCAASHRAAMVASVTVPA